MFSHHPQTLALQLSDIPKARLEAIARNGCLAYCYLRCMGIDDGLEGLSLILSAMNKKIIAEDCYVNDGEKFLEHITGKRWTIQKVKPDEIDINTPTPVWYSIDGVSGHWVVEYKGEIIFNSLEISNNVLHGERRSARKIILKE